MLHELAGGDTEILRGLTHSSPRRSSAALQCHSKFTVLSPYSLIAPSQMLKNNLAFACGFSCTVRFESLSACQRYLRNFTDAQGILV